MIDEFTALTGYDRNYSSSLLRLYYKKYIGSIYKGKAKIRYDIGKDKRK